MPKNLFQEIVFTVLMVFVMVYAMICYNIALNMGGMSNAVFLKAFHELVIMAPIAFVLDFFDLNVTFLVSIGCVLVIFTKILMFYKWLKLFSCNIYGVFLLILYFCALEIVPCLIVYQGMIQLNNVLIINF